MTTTVTRPVLKYFGSKWRMATKIIELLGTEHTSYIEPYGGSAAVLLQKPKVDIEVMNDLNLDVVTFFRVLRDSPIELLQQIELTPFSRVEYLASTAAGADLPDIERARLFFIRSWQGFSGSATQARNGWRYQSRVYGNRLTKVDLDWHALDRLEAAAVRLRQVQIERDDALAVIKRFDGPGTAFYVDPPYPETTRSKQWGKDAYQHELMTQDHIHLLNLLNRVRGRVVLSCYESGLYSQMWGGGGAGKKSKCPPSTIATSRVSKSFG
jgi:DNA adenine methylase